MVGLVRNPFHCAHWGWSIAVVVFLSIAGCGGPEEGIKTYRVATPTQNGTDKSEKPAAPEAVPEDNGPAKVRLLGAIIPVGGGSSYFVKFSGPIEKIDANEKDFDAFLNSIRVPGEGGKPISWIAPPGWKEAPAKTMRVVTFQKVDGDAPDLYISDPIAGSLLDNVIRWQKGDVGIKPATEADLPSIAKEIQLGSTKAFRVDMRGPGGKGGMGGPFMNKGR